MNQTHLSAILQQEASAAGFTQGKLAELTNVTQGAISQLIAKGYRAAPATLRQLTHCWPKPGTGIKILTAHLFDEIKRAGHAPENFEIRSHGTSILNIPTAFEEDLAYLRITSEQVPILRELIHNIVALTQEELSKLGPFNEMAAEKRTRYGKN